MMNKTPNNAGTGNTSTQAGRAFRKKNPVSTSSLIILGVCFFVLVVFTIMLYQQFKATGEYGLLAYLIGMLATAVFLWLSALFASRIRTNRIKKEKPARDNILNALISTIQESDDPNARLAAVKGLSELDLEESTEHMKHKDIDDILISVLKNDPDSRVRTAAAEGLSVVELEKQSFYHAHDRLYGTLLKHGIVD